MLLLITSKVIKIFKIKNNLNKNYFTIEKNLSEKLNIFTPL